MFEAYINRLRTQRVSVAKLGPPAFTHRRSLCDAFAAPGCQCSGWSSWSSEGEYGPWAIAWPWNVIRQNLVVPDPMRIQSNLLLVDEQALLVTEQRALATLLLLITGLEWQRFALRRAKANLSRRNSMSQSVGPVGISS